jgi:AAA ATPase domain/Protein kinase domain
MDPESGGAWLTGFGNAIDAFAKDTTAWRVHVATGSLKYTAPELSERTNRVLDSRADLYALGCIFYEMVTGASPVTAGDALDAMHSHMATRPPSPTKFRREFPRQISAIIERLIATDPNDPLCVRTRTGRGPAMVPCRAAQGKVIASFPLDQAIFRRLSLPNQLYGRGRELGMLASAFARVAARGVTEMVIVSGESGLGKSAVVREFEASTA